MTVPALPLICNKPRFLNFRSWRPCSVITVVVLHDEGGFQEAIPKKRSISEHPSIYHSRKAIFSYATLKSGGLSPFAAVEAWGVFTLRAAGLLPVTPDDRHDINAAITFHTWGYYTATVEIQQELPTISLLKPQWYSVPATEFGQQHFQHTHCLFLFFF